MLWIDSSENHSDFSKEIFFNFSFHTNEKQSIINLSIYRSVSFASVVLRDSEVNFLSERKDAAFCPFLYCILFICSIGKSSSRSSNLLVFHTSRSILLRPAAFLLLIFVSYTFGSFAVN